jgi:hypothetical protein
MAPRRGRRIARTLSGSKSAMAMPSEASPVQAIQRDITAPALSPWRRDFKEEKSDRGRLEKRQIAKVHHFRLRAQPIYGEKIWVINHFLTADECSAWMRYAETATFEETYHPASREFAFRDNGRIECVDAVVAETIWKRLKPFVPETVDGLHPVGCYDKIRLYRYRAGGQRFGKHIDESVDGRETGTATKITVLIYLNGAESGLMGGETVFYCEAGNAKAVRFSPGPGALLYHGYVT